MATANGPDVKERVQAERQRRRQSARDERIRRATNHDRTIIEFQPDAVEIEHRKVPFGARWTLYTVTGFIVTFVAWACWAEVDQIVVAEGKLITTEKAIVIQSFTGSPIQSIEVDFGDRVKAGQVVATLDTTFNEADLEDLRARKDALEAFVARLKAEINEQDFVISADKQGDRDWETQRMLYDARKNQVAKQLEKFEADGKKIQVQMESARNSVDHQSQQLVPRLKDFANRQAELYKSKSATFSASENAQIGWLNAEAELITTRNSIKELQEDLLGKIKEKEVFIFNQRAAIADEYATKIQELTSVEQELQKANRMNELHELRVPVDSGHDEFVVFEVADISVGSVPQQGAPIFRLIPIDVPFEAEVEVTGKDVAKIRELESEPTDGNMPRGSEVTLKLSAFDYQDHGTLKGYVRTISEGVYKDPNQPSDLAANFKARIKILDTVKLENVPKDFRLLPGMTATAEIKVGTRRVVAYFLYPVLRYLDNGLREP